MSNAKLEDLIRTIAKCLVAEGDYPSIPKIRSRLARELGARTPGYPAIGKIREAMLEAGTFPLAGGRSVPTRPILPPRPPRKPSQPDSIIRRGRRCLATSSPRKGPG